MKNWRGPALNAGVLAVALLPRLLYLFVFSNPENPGDGPYIDVYQHWQIGYLTQQIGLRHGFRLWDLKGVEYFWSTLHPLILAGLFTLLHSADIVIPRLLSIVAGSVSVLLIFQLCRRYWGMPVALFAAGFAALFPISVFNDASGMLEPLGVALILLALWLYPGHPFFAGIALALATAARPEAWLFSAGLVVAALLRRDPDHDRRPLLYGWTPVMAAQVLFLWSRTGNPIYPVYWNFLANASGKWVAIPNAQQLAMRPLFILLWLLATAGLAAGLWRRPPSYLLLVYGCGYSALIFGLLGFTPFLSNWLSWSWMMWILEFPYEFAGILLALGIFRLRTSLPPLLGSSAVALAGGAAALSLVLWLPVQQIYAGTDPAWETTRAAGRTVAALYRQLASDGGTLNLPPDRPDLTYQLVSAGVPATALISQLYDPRYYLAGRAAEAADTLDNLYGCWLEATHSRLLLVDTHDPAYLTLLADRPEWFQQVGTIPAFHLTLEAVDMTKAAGNDRPLCPPSF